jgi:arginyl-tRNA synthetase
MFKAEIVKILKLVGIKIEENSLEVPPQDEFGDLSFPCFQLAKIQKKNPQLIAEVIAKKIRLGKNSIISKVEAKGAYVNFFFNYPIVSKIVLSEILKKGEKYGTEKIKNKTAVVDFSSPNPAHPIHVGSARSTFIGESLSRILEFSGYKTKRICYVNNLGRQVAILVWSYLKFAKEKKPDKKFDHWLLDIYVKGNEAIAQNPKLEEEIEETLRKLEKKDKELFPVSKRLVGWCLEGFQETYKKLGIKFDEYIWESEFAESSKSYAKKLVDGKFAFKTDDGAMVIELEKYGLPNTILLRKDGTGLYLIRDIGAGIYKFKKYKPSLNIYVVAEDQKLHFQQEFKIFELLGYKELARNSFHLSYGYVNLPEGKLSSRLGRVVLIDDVFDEATKRVRSHTKDENIARAVGIAAVIYAILRIDPDKQVTFNWDEVLSLEGNTAPYLQYAHTRCSGILKKSKKWKPNYSVKGLAEHERILVKILSKFSQTVYQASQELRPNYVCNYVYDLATAFNEFYEKCPVIKAEKKLKDFRLTLVKATQIVLKNALNLIGIEAVEKM